jgi:hypothetical protein
MSENVREIPQKWVNVAPARRRALAAGSDLARPSEGIRAKMPQNATKTGQFWETALPATHVAVSATTGHLSACLVSHYDPHVETLPGPVRHSPAPAVNLDDVPIVYPQPAHADGIE